MSWSWSSMLWRKSYDYPGSSTLRMSSIRCWAWRSFQGRNSQPTAMNIKNPNNQRDRIALKDLKKMENRMTLRIRTRHLSCTKNTWNGSFWFSRKCPSRSVRTRISGKMMRTTLRIPKMSTNTKPCRWPMRRRSRLKFQESAIHPKWKECDFTKRIVAKRRNLWTI